MKRLYETCSPVCLVSVQAEDGRRINMSEGHIETSCKSHRDGGAPLRARVLPAGPHWFVVSRQISMKEAGARISNWNGAPG